MSLLLQPSLLEVEPGPWAPLMSDGTDEPDPQVASQTRAAPPSAVHFHPVMLDLAPAGPVNPTATVAPRSKSPRFRWPLAQRGRGEPHYFRGILQRRIEHGDVGGPWSRVSGEGVLGSRVSLGIAISMAALLRIGNRRHVDVCFDLAYTVPQPKLCRIRMRIPHYPSIALSSTELCTGPRSRVAHHVLAVPMHRRRPPQVLGGNGIRRVFSGLRRLRQFPPQGRVHRHDVFPLLVFDENGQAGSA